MDYAGQYLAVGAALLLALAFGVAGLSANALLRPTVKTGQKLATYECGVPALGSGWTQGRVRYYQYGFLYVIFAIDAVYLFPWALMIDRPGFGAIAAAEMAIFLGFLAVGLAYAWRQGVLRWT